MSPLHNPAHEEKRGLSFVMAVLMHVVLAGALLVSVQWKTKKPAPVVVELWGGPPPAPAADPIAQPAVKAKPVKVEPAKPEVVPDKVDIATEKVQATVKPTASPTPTPKPTATPKVTAAPTATPKATAVPKATAAPKPTATPVTKPTATPKAKVPPKKSELEDALSFDNVVASNNKTDAKPIPGSKPGGTGTNPKAVGNSGPGNGTGSNKAGLDSYKGRLIQQIKSRAVYDKNAGNPTAEFSVVVLPDGSILESQLQLLASSGDPAYAEATKRAILTMGRFPPLPDGQTFTGELRTWKIKFRLKEVND